MDRRDLQNERDWMSRIFTGQVSFVDETNGVMHVVVPQLDHCFTVNIPLAGLSVNGFGSSWLRHMPRTNDCVLLGFSTDNTPEVLAVTTWSADPSAAADGGAFERKLGYARLARLSENSQADQNAVDPATGNNQPIGLDEFIPLKGGEFDMRSSGGGYIHGSRFGHLTLAGGQVRLKADKQRDELLGQAGLYTLSSAHSYVTLGDVKRVMTPLALPSVPPTPPTIPFNPVYPGKEWNVHVGIGLGPIAVPCYDLKAGDVRSDILGVPDIPVVPGIPVRLDETITGVDGVVPTYVKKVDSEGNWSVNTVRSTLASYLAPVTTLQATLAVMSVTASGAVSVAAGGAVSVSAGAALSLSAGAALSATAGGLLSLTAGGAFALTTVGPVTLGGPLAIHPAVHGEVLLLNLQLLVNGLNALFSGLMGLEGGPLSPKGALYSTMVGILTGVTTSLSLPPGPAGLLSAKVLVE